MKPPKFTANKQLDQLSRTLAKTGFDSETLRQLASAEELLLLVKEMLQGGDQYEIRVMNSSVGLRFALHLNGRPFGIRGSDSIKLCAFAKHPRLKVVNGLDWSSVFPEDKFNKIKKEYFPQAK